MSEAAAKEAPQTGGSALAYGARWVRGLHLLALAGFALAQPMFDVLARDAAFFVVRRSQPIDIWLLTAVLALAAPLLLWLVELLCGLAGRRVEGAVHLVFVAGLAALALAPLVKRSIEAPDTVILSVLAGAAVLFAVLYARSKGLRSFLSILSPAALVFAGVFLFHPSIQKIRDRDATTVELSGVDADTTVVLLIVDELPLSSLLDDQLEFEALFPNFARLASESVWFRNASASHAHTTTVVPAILSGRMPELGLLPFAADHPQSMFTLFGGSYRLRVEETVTELCPAQLRGEQEGADPLAVRARSLWDDLSIVYQHIVAPPQLATSLPAVSGVWGGFRAAMPDFGGAQIADVLRELRGRAVRAGRARLFVESLENIDRDTQPTLYFTHVVLPHKPWELLPSGKRYLTDNLSPGNFNGVWSHEERLTAFAYQRHLLALGGVDLLLGKFLDRLQEQGVYDRSLVVVLADHGGAFVPGVHTRKPHPDNLRDVIHVPLFVKLPFQEEGRVSDRNVESIDVLPTIADVLDIEIPWDVDGSSGLDESVPARPEKQIFRNDKRKPTTVDGAFPGHFETILRKNRLFGEDRDWKSIYALGSRRDWIGRETSSMTLADPAPALAHVDQLDALGAVDLDSGLVPSYVKGNIESEDPELLASDVLVALNGVLCAQATTFGVQEGRRDFVVILPDFAMHDGSNLLELFAVRPDESLAPVSTISYRLVADARGERVVSSVGREFPLVGDGTLGGRVDKAELDEAGLSLVGWAADRSRQMPADAVLLVLDGGRVVPAEMGRVRKGFPPASPMRECGFVAFLPLDLFAGGEPGDVRALALIDGRAFEVGLGKNAEWLAE